MKNGLANIFIATMLLVFVSSAAAQEPQPEEDFQSWNDVQLTIPLSPKLDFQTQFTRLGKNDASNDGRFLAAGL